MSEYVVKSHNCETGEIEERPMTPEEIEIHLEIQKDYVERKKREKEELEAKEEARVAVLEKLGITLEEAKALLS